MPPEREYIMDDAACKRRQHQPSVPVLSRLSLAISRSTGGVVPRRVMAGVQAGLLLLLLVGCATPDWQGHGQPARTQQDIVAAHPEWPSGIRAAMASGVISAGMSPEMVRAAWGHPTRTASEGSGWHQRDTWYYAGRQHNADMIGGQTGGAQALGEWTVAFTHGGVVGWTD
jgi:hypothetical protein